MDSRSTRVKLHFVVLTLIWVNNEHSVLQYAQLESQTPKLNEFLHTNISLAKEERSGMGVDVIKKLKHATVPF